MSAAVVTTMLVLFVPVLSTEPDDAVDPAPSGAPYDPYAKAVLVASDIDSPDAVPDSLPVVAGAPPPSSSPPEAVLPALEEFVLVLGCVRYEEIETEPVAATSSR